MRIPVVNVVPRGSFRFVGENEVLLADDLVRNTDYTNSSDTVNFDDINAMNWQRVDHGLCGWVGRTLRDYHRAGFSSRYGTSSVEVIRLLKDTK